MARTIRITMTRTTMAVITMLLRQCRQLQWTVTLLSLLVFIALVTVAQFRTATTMTGRLWSRSGRFLCRQIPATTL